MDMITKNYLRIAQIIVIILLLLSFFFENYAIGTALSFLLVSAITAGYIYKLIRMKKKNSFRLTSISKDSFKEIPEDQDTSK